MGLRRKYTLLIAALLVSTSWLVHISTAEQELYSDYETLIDAFKTLADTRPELASYEAIGKTVNGQDIIIFKIGNRDGGVVLYDGTMHGTESLGGGLLYFYMKWLLESGESLATRILARDYTLLIPVLNVDGMKRYTRTNANGVDLNRNFVTDWEHGSSVPTSEMYRGPEPLSEPESQALIRVLKNYRPAFYVNLHMWNGPYYAGSYYAENSNYGSLKSQIDSFTHARFSPEQGVAPFHFQGEFLGKGFAISDAAIEGATSFLVELGRTSYLRSAMQINSILRGGP